MCHREVLTEEVCTEEVYQRGGFMILAADIGGTKLLFGLFEVREGSKLARNIYEGIKAGSLCHFMKRQRRFFRM